MASNINTAGIDETKPANGTATTQSVRDNFSEIKTQLDTAASEITSLQSDVNALAQAVVYQGQWDASSGSAPAASPSHGDMYRVSVAGTWDSKDWNVGDEAIYNSNTLAWEKFDNTSPVSSVNGYSGAVSLVAADVSAYTTTQVDTKIANNKLRVYDTGGTELTYGDL